MFIKGASLKGKKYPEGEEQSLMIGKPWPRGYKTLIQSQTQNKAQ